MEFEEFVSKPEHWFVGDLNKSHVSGVQRLMSSLNLY